MISLEDALATVLAGCEPLPAREVPVGEALGLVLAEPVRAAEPVPPFANSAMDGYAVRAADVAGASPQRPARLRVIGTQQAGRPPAGPVGPGEALRIMTGAVFPEGADAVAIVETTRTEADLVLVEAPAEPGDHVRWPGEDVAAGEEVLAGGTQLEAGHIGVLCSVGRAAVTAFPAPTVGVISTGDELVEPGAPIRAGQIRDSNRRTLLGLLARDGFRGVDLGICADDEAEIEERLALAARTCDAVLTSGGVSMGDFDFVKTVLDRVAEMHWMQVAIRPAKPFAFGRIGKVPVFGLPGNPVSSMVSYEVLARPGLRRMAGFPPSSLRRPEVPGIAAGHLAGGRDGRTTFARVRAEFGEDGRLWASPLAGQGSHQLKAMSRSNALAVVEPGKQVSPGEAVQLLLLWL